jgi:hypothetical protein
MSPIRRFAPLALALACTCGPAACAEDGEDGGARLVRELHAAHRPWQESPLDLADPAVTARYFCQGLQQAFAHEARRAAACPEGEVCGLDFDPILAAQDPGDGKDLALRIEALPEPATHRVAARFHLFGASGEETVVQHQLARQGSRWCIEDIVYPGLDGLSLKAQLLQP